MINIKALEERNQKIINAVIKKADKVCPGSLAMIGIYGSFLTGDIREGSDLDLLVLINDERGRGLSRAFIQDDLGVGHDIYCTSWEDLEEASLYNDPNISKLMDSRVVYCADAEHLKRLEALRKRARNILSSPFSYEDYVKAEKTLKEAEHFYLSAMTADNISDMRARSGYALYYLENAVAMLNKKYFRLGVKRVYEELEQMEDKPRGLCEMIESVVSAGSAEQLGRSLTALVYETARTFEKARASVLHKAPITADTVSGTYEEMFSNWRNKMRAAADEGNRHLAFMSMSCLNAMLSDLGAETDIGEYDVFVGFDPNDLKKAEAAFDDIINDYLNEYRRAGIRAERYRDIDEFAEKYTE